VNRTFVYLAALVGFGGMIYLAGASQAQPGGGPPGAPPPGAPAPTAQSRPTIAVFNMAGVMRDYGKAKYQVWLLNKRRLEISGDLGKWRTDYIDTQKTAQATADPKLREQYTQKLVNLARLIEDKDREVNKTLNDEASKIISGLYDEIKTVVDKTAEMNGYHVVFAYPDAVTPEEQQNPFLKELKLKPPAAQPFYVSPQVDITGVVITTLNKWYPPRDAQNNPVDVTKLPPLENAPQPGASAPGTGAPSTVPPGGGVPGAPPGAPPGVPGAPPGAPRQ
jgi:Skp family chaperone for outer membrane proteins